MAVAKFREGLNLTAKNKAVCSGNTRLFQLETHLLILRALSLHQMDNKKDAASDCSEVADKFKHQFTKDLKHNQPLMKDLDQLAKLEPRLTSLLPKKEESKKASAASSTSKTEEEEAKQKSKAAGPKTKILDKSTVDKAAQLATDEATSQVFKAVPKTAAGFEKDFNQLKKDSAKVF
mmetsp:Transcript_7226/g.12199  ORF Transcript_7226/g.12199 Transcript_7226/m.12199 type:complete len:177 (+) Transcript_7226:752-1282(+)